MTSQNDKMESDVKEIINPIKLSDLPEQPTEGTDDTKEPQHPKQNTTTKPIGNVKIGVTSKKDERRRVEHVANESKHLLHDRRTGAMSVTGQLYETKLLTLILIRLMNEDSVEFFLGTNISGAGALDDLCFKYKPVNGRHVIVFLQAKHKVDPDKGKITMKLMKKYDSDFSVEKHFESYLMIRQKFTPKSSDIIFKSAYHETLCYFVVYTPLKDEVESRKPLQHNDTNDKVKDFIQTNRFGDIFQLDNEDVDFLHKNLLEKHARQLGKTFVDLILNVNGNVNMDDGIIKTYHVVLAQNVIELTDTDVEGVRRGTFRRDFFDNKEKLTTIFRETMFEELVNKALHTTVDLTLLKNVGDNPSVDNISLVIGSVVNYNQKTNLLELIDEKSRNDKDLEFLKQMKIDPSTIKNAVNVKGQHILQNMQFNVPSGFGNKDLTLKGNLKKIEKRLEFLAVRLARLFESAVFTNGVNFVDVDERMVGPDGVVERGVVEHNGGLASALGNLLVFDKDTDALKFNSSEPLPELASKLWNKLKITHSEELLNSYRFKLRIESFPKAYFAENWYEEYLVNDFISQYWLCTGQAKEDVVETIAKTEINKYIKVQIGHQPPLRATTDGIFLILHDIVQKWWMLPDKAEYLTRNTDYVQRATSEVVKNPMLSVLNVICLMKLRSSGIEFDKAAVKCLGLDKVRGLLLIVTDSVTHTAVKVMQHYTHSSAFIDLNYVTNMLFNIQDLIQELNNSNLDTFIITCGRTGNVEIICEVLSQFMNDLKKANIIVIVDTNVYTILKQQLTCTYHEVKDIKNGLVDLTSKAQEKILNECKVVFQGEEVSLKSILDEDMKHFITSHTLQKLVNKERVVIGKPIASAAFSDIKESYVDRNLVYNGDYKDPEGPKTELFLLALDVFVVTAPPGMGKSTLLTYMSLETKNMYPEVWIARINLLSHSKQFHLWQKNKVVIDNGVALAFLCKLVSSGDIKFKVVNTCKGTVLIRDNIDPDDLLQADLFIHAYKNGKTIIIFDGFDEIFPLYEETVVELIKVIANSAVCADRVTQPKLWISSRSYNTVRQVIGREFGLSYRLEPLTKMENKIYFNKLWKRTMKLDEFTYDQLMNVNSFIEYMREFWHVPGRSDKAFHVKTIVIALFEMYFEAVNFFQNEIQNIMPTPENKLFKQNWILELAVDPSFKLQDHDPRRLKADFSYVWRTCHMAASPLQTHIAAEFFANQIKYNLSNYDVNKWDLEYNTFYIYEHYLETKLLKIRFGEKNRIDIYNPDIIGIYERERKKFIDMHRKLAFYSIFRDKSSALMSEYNLGEVKSAMDKVKYATEKTGVIDCIVDDVPIFVHLIFAEYFAVDHICSMLKMAFASTQIDRQESIWRFVISPTFRASTLGFTNMFDNKLELDAKLENELFSLGLLNVEKLPQFKEILEDPRSEKIVFEALLRQGTTDSWSNVQNTFFDIVARGMHHTSMFILKSIIKCMDKNDVDNLVSLLSFRQFLRSAVQHRFEEVLCLAFDFIREVNLGELDRVLQNNGIFYGPQLASISNEQIITDLKR